MPDYEYSDIILEIRGKIGIIKFNRPKTLNSFGGSLIIDTIHALRVLDNDADTVFTVITGAGRFFSSGADVRAEADGSKLDSASDAANKLAVLNRNNASTQLVSSMINHRKVIVLAMNGPAVGGGAAWFQGVADIVFASTTTWLQCPFSALGLVPEFGSASTFPQSIGVHRANDILMFGRKVPVDELVQWGMVNRVFEHEGFHASVIAFLKEQLEINDGRSMMEHKRLMNAPLRAGRMLALHDAADAVAERFVEGAPAERFTRKSQLLAGKEIEEESQTLGRSTATSIINLNSSPKSLS